MDTGTWTLRCQGCREIFDLELKSGERIIQYAREAACPHCHNKPENFGITLSVFAMSAPMKFKPATFFLRFRHD